MIDATTTTTLEVHPDSIAKAILVTLMEVVALGKSAGSISPEFFIKAVLCESIDQRTLRITTQVSYDDKRHQASSSD